MKWLKRMLWLLLALVVVAVAAPFIAIQLMDPAWVKSEIAARVEAATGRTLAIEGDVKLTAYPWLGAELGTVTLGNAAGFPQPFFARIKSAVVRVKLMPLLDREVRMDTVTVDGLELNLARTADGRTNWDDLAGQGAAPAAGGDARPLAALALGGINVRGGHIDWIDGVAKTRTVVSSLDLSTGAIDLARGTPDVDVKSSFGLAHDKPTLQSLVAVDTTLTWDAQAQTLRASGLKLSLDGKGDALGGAVKTTLTGDVRYSVADGRLQVEGLKLSDTQINAAGTTAALAAQSRSLDVDTATGAVVASGLDADITQFVLASGLGGSLKLKGDARVDGGGTSVRLAGLDASGTLSGGPLGKGKLPFATKTDVTYDGARRTVALPGLDLALKQFSVDETTGDLRVQGDVAVALAGPQITSRKLAVNGTLGGRAVRGGSTNVALTTALDADLRSGVVTLGDLRLKLSELKTLGVSGAIDLAGNAAGNTRTNVFSVKGLDVSTQLAGEQFPQGRMDAKLKLNAVANLAKQSVNVSTFSADAYGLNGNGSLNVQGLGGAPTLDGAVTMAPFSPRAVLKTFGQPEPRTADPKALTRASLKTRFSATTKRLKLDDLTLKLDDSTLKGDLTLTDFQKPAYVFDLNVDGMDIERYMAPGSGGQAATPGAAAAAAATLPLETLRALNARGQLGVGKMRIANLKISNIAMKLDASGGDVKLTPFNARLYGGRYNGNIALDARGKQASLSFDERLEGVDLGALLTDLKGKAALTGTTSAEARLTTRGNDANQLIAALNGTAAFRVDNGAISKIDIVRTICNLVEGGQTGETRFDAMVGTAKVVNGVVENDRLDVSSPLLRIAARGVVDLPRDQLDYRGDVSLVGTCKGQGGRLRDQLNGVDIPIRVTGSIANPNPTLDTGKIVEAVARREIERKSERITQKIQEKVGEEAGKALGDSAKKLTEGLLKGLLGN